MVDASLPMIITDNSRGKAHGGIHPPLTIPRDSSFFSNNPMMVTHREGNDNEKKYKIKKTSPSLHMFLAHLDSQ